MKAYDDLEVECLINVFDSFSRSEFAPLIAHSIDVAKLSCAIADRVAPGRFGRAFLYLSGLLHDWGLFVRNTLVDPSLFGAILGSSVLAPRNGGRSFDFDFATERLEGSRIEAHARISSSIVEYVGLPEPYLTAVGNHHRGPNGASGGNDAELLTCIVQAADLISRAYRKALARGMAAGFGAVYDLVDGGAFPVPIRPAAMSLLDDPIDSNYTLDGLTRAELYMSGYTADLSTFIRLVEILSYSQDYRSPFTRNHSFRIATLAKDIGLELLCERDARELRLAGLVHDFGKITIPLEILHKPGALDPMEARVMKGHVVESIKMFDPAPGLGEILRAAFWHHERLDGSGYPYGLKAPSIPLRARIVQVCDCYVALAEDRPYRPALQPPEALAFIEEEALGGRLDGDVYETLRSFVRNGYELGENDELLTAFLRREPEYLESAASAPRGR